MLVEVQRSGSAVVVDGVTDEFVLQLAEEAEVKAREADRSKLRIATHWAERHQVDDVLEAAHWSDADLRDICEPIGGEGTPLIHEAAVTPLAAALGVSARSAMQLMSDGLDLKHRLPMTDLAVEELRLAPWRGQQIAQLTHRLSAEAAAYVDAAVARSPTPPGAHASSGWSTTRPLGSTPRSRLRPRTSRRQPGVFDWRTTQAPSGPARRASR